LRNGGAMTYIYLDVLLITNIYVNYFLLKATAKISHTAFKLLRCIAGAGAGALSSLIIVFPKLSIAVLVMVKITAAALIIRIAFNGLTIKRYLRLTIIFIIVSFIFSGVMMLICEIFKINSVIVNNYSVYFNISILTLIISTILAYIAVCTASRIFDKHLNLGHSYKIIVDISGRTFSLSAVSDTGNSLVDSFTGKPVIICSCGELNSLLRLNENCVYEAEDYLSILKNQKGLRLLPYSTIGNSGIIPAFSAESIIIQNENHESKPVDAFIGISTVKNNEAQAVFNPRLLI
jgi:stage II sporulation protein GA (sporulation sigma-E factor processing peptidase)